MLSETKLPRQFAVQAAMSEAASAEDVEILHEDGSLDRYQVPLADLPEAEFAEFDGVRYTRKFVPLPQTLPLGYYDVIVAIGERLPEFMRLILTPDRAWLPDDLRTAGSPSACTACGRPATGDAAIFAICATWSTGWRRTWRELRGLESAARDPQPPAVQHQPLSSELDLLSEFPLPGCRGAWRIFKSSPRAQRC